MNPSGIGISENTNHRYSQKVKVVLIMHVQRRNDTISIFCSQ